MIETELKITLAPADLARLRRHPALAALRVAPRRTARLLSIYCDTQDHALARAGVSLRLRRVGRAWVQTVKSGRLAQGTGFFSHREIERPAPGGRLALDGPDPWGVYAAIAEAAGDAPLAAVFETRVERVTERLRLPDGGQVELALDRGEIAAGAARRPIMEAELELIEGDAGALFALARRLFPDGPIEFSSANKAALGYRLANGGPVAAAAAARKAGAVDFARDATLESVTRDVLRDCFAQIAQNVVVVARCDAPEGPHQLRVGLRRLRTAFSIFAPSLGSPAIAPLSEAARRLGRIVGALRDMDVLIGEVIGEATASGPDAQARGALLAALEARRAAIRIEVRADLAGPGTTAFLFDLLELIETRGWLAPADYGQTARLAAPIGALAPQLLGKRRAKALRLGRRIERRDGAALHDLRKALKKLRYATDMLAPIFSGRKVARYRRALKKLQERFGSLNDAAMAMEALTGLDAPAREDPAAQRAAGWILGAMGARAGEDRPKLFRRWRGFAESRPFWS